MSRLANRAVARAAASSPDHGNRCAYCAHCTRGTRGTRGASLRPDTTGNPLDSGMPA